MCQNVLINAFFEEVWRNSFATPVAITTRWLIGLCCRRTHFQLLSNYSRLVRMLSLHPFQGLNTRSRQRGCSFIMHCSALCVIHPSLIIRCTTSFSRAAPASDLPWNSILLLSASQGHPTDENCTFHCFWRERLEVEMTDRRGSHHLLHFPFLSDFSGFFSFWKMKYWKSFLFPF